MVCAAPSACLHRSAADRRYHREAQEVQSDKWVILWTQQSCFRDMAARNPDVAVLAQASNAHERPVTLIQQSGQSRPIHLTIADEAAPRQATWEHQPPLFTLSRN